MMPDCAASRWAMIAARTPDPPAGVRRRNPGGRCETRREHVELLVGAAGLANNLLVIADLLRRKPPRRRRAAA